MLDSFPMSYLVHTVDCFDSDGGSPVTRWHF